MQLLIFCGYSILVGVIWYVMPSPILVIAAFLAPAIVVKLTKIPYIICLGFIIFSFFRIHEAFPFLSPLHIPQLLALATLGVLVWHLFVSKEINCYWTPQLSWFVAFFALVVVGVIFASNSGKAIGYFNSTYIKIAILVFAIVWLSKSPSDFLLASRLFLLSGVVIACVALSNKMNGIGLVEGTRVTIGRDIGSILGDPNDLSLVLLFPCGFGLSLFFSTGLSKCERYLAGLSYFLLVSAIIATQSRGGLLGIMVISGYFAWIKVKSKMLLISGAAVLLPILLVLAGISDRSSGGAAEEGIDESAMGRIYAWGAAYKMALSNPLTGVGINNFLVNYYYYSAHWDGLNHAVHSTWFGILAETGFLGLTVFLCLLASLLRKLKTAQRQISLLILMVENNSCLLSRNKLITIQYYSFALFAGFLSFMVSGTFLTQGFTWPFYILMALTISLCNYIEHQYIAHNTQVITQE
ncbi:O-antigen ligase family protein [Pseudoalteromonas denitrificans]|uniref:O-antigen ligase n=1 Tax=Pseudoalteromonas denitrificans DSM 6059 TaxID=1123010 RepID=A0A1I1EVU7_9GAMM|nr:O-antigen ligase family protein [Pseudoalteromonas denitrificans]SFB89023.1 O-antigen ligase [Pseudoalteromonas denitrificans DSM 6059]